MKSNILKLAIGVSVSVLTFFFLWFLLPAKVLVPLVLIMNGTDSILILVILSGLLPSIYPLMKKDWWMLVGTLLIGPLVAIGILGFLWGMQVT